MANKVAPKISPVGPGKMSNKGAHNPNVGTSGSGLAPKPKPSNPDRAASLGTAAGLARAGSEPSSGSGSAGSAGSFLPVQKPKAGLANTPTPYGGHGTPPSQRGGPSGLRAGGKNQGWPNGPMYTDAIKKGGSGKDSGPIATRMPKRRGKGAAFYGEYS